MKENQNMQLDGTELILLRIFLKLRGLVIYFRFLGIHLSVDLTCPSNIAVLVQASIATEIFPDHTKGS